MNNEQEGKPPWHCHVTLGDQGQKIEVVVEKEHILSRGQGIPHLKNDSNEVVIVGKEGNSLLQKGVGIPQKSMLLAHHSSALHLQDCVLLSA